MRIIAPGYHTTLTGESVYIPYFVISGGADMPLGLQQRITQRALELLNTSQVSTVAEGIESAMRDGEIWNGYESWL